jgi:adenylate cyclase
MESFSVKPAAGQSTRCCLGACVITDAERYTSIAERIDPASAVELINHYFGKLFRPVFDNGGFISDVKGDGVLAVWADAAPAAELRARACRACLEMADSVAHFQAGPGSGLSTRIGASFGPIALATVGALAHYEYRAVGDTVNVSSRLQELNKLLGTRILVSAALVEELDEFLFRDLGEFELRGKRNRVRVRELVARRAEASAQQLRLCAEFAAASAAQRHGRWDEAYARLRELCARHPEDGPSRLQLHRCRAAVDERRDLAEAILGPMLIPGATGLDWPLASTEG